MAESPWGYRGDSAGVIEHSRLGLVVAVAAGQKTVCLAFYTCRAGKTRCGREWAALDGLCLCVRVGSATGRIKKLRVWQVSTPYFILYFFAIQKAKLLKGHDGIFGGGL